MAQVRQDNVQIKLEIDGSQSKTELDNLTRRAQVLQQGLKEMKRGTDEYIASNKELSQVNKRMEELRNDIGLTGLSTDQLGKLAKQLSRELRGLVPDTEAYIAKSKELVTVENRLTELRSGLQLVRDSLDQSGNSFSSFVKKAVGFAGIQLGIEAVVSSLKELGQESIRAAVEGSDSISDMEKSLNLTTAEAKALRGQLENIDTRTSEANLEGIAVAAGQLGIAKDQAVAFTESVDQAVVALGDEFTGGVEDVTKSLGGLQKLFKETADVSPADAITKIGSAVNALGADGTATGPVIADFAARIGQLGNLAPQITQTLGLGAAFQELGLSAEISAGGLSNILLTAAKGTADFGRQLGMTTQEFEDLINHDPNEVIIRLAASLKGASETEIVTTLDKLGIKSQEATKVISLLADKSDFVRQKQALASAEYEKGTSLLDEFAKKNTNAAAEVAKAEKGFAQYRQELGEQLLPIYLKVLQYTGLVIDVLRALPGFVAENKTAFGLLALALAFYNGEQIKTQVATLRTLALQKLVALGVLTEVEGKYSLATANGVLTAAQEGLNVAMEANPIGFIITLLALFAFGLKQLYDRSETFRAAVDSLFVMLKPLGELFGSLGGQIGALFVQLGRLFGSIGGGKAVLEIFGAVLGVAVVVPLKLMITQVQAAIDVLAGFINVGKKVANFFGADFAVDTNSFDAFTQHLTENAKSIGRTLIGADGAQEASFSLIPVYQGVLNQQADFLAQGQAQQQAAAAKKKEEAAKNDLESLKERYANIKAALALVEAGSAEELRLKKLEVVTKRDIDLLGEKKTAGDKKVIVAEALRDLRQLQDDYDKKTKEAAEKRAKEQADVEKKIADLRAAQIPDETERRIAQLIAAADREAAVVKGTAEQIAEQRRLIMDKLAVDIEATQVAAAQKRGLAELEVEKMNNALIKNQFDRKDAEIDTAAKEAKLKLVATEADYAKKVKAIDDKALADHKANDEERVAYRKGVLDRIKDLESEADAIRFAERRKKAGQNSAEQKKIDEEEEEKGQDKLDKQQKTMLDALDKAHELGLISDEDYEEAKAALFDSFLEKKNDLHAKYVQDQLDREKQAQIEGLEMMSEYVATIGGIVKAFGDRDLQREAANKKKRLASLDAEYKAGTISKEQYEAQKLTIEANYDEKTRAIKKEAAEREKAFNIAEAIIQTALSIVKASPNPYLMAAAGIVGAASVAKIIATPIPEFEKGGFFGRVGRGIKHYATGGRINARAGVADVGQRHSGGGIRMVDGATGQHLGEWERGEPYMILSRDTYANNKYLVDELIDTSLHRGGAPVRPKPGFYEDGGTFSSSSAAPTTASAQADSRELVQLLRETRDAVRALPSRQYIGWDQGDTAELEQRLDERADDRRSGEVR